jgi:hypothetical protein
MSFHHRCDTHVLIDQPEKLWKAARITTITKASPKKHLIDPDIYCSAKTFYDSPYFFTPLGSIPFSQK